MRILVIGGTGFIGRHIVARLAADEHRVKVPTRRYAQGRPLLVLPTVTVLERDIHDDAALDDLVQGCDAVINLVGVLHGGQGKPYGAGFARAHVHLPERVALACQRHGVGRFVHLSALGADSDGPSMYTRSKGDGEAAIRKVLGDPGPWTIFRPSVVFGAEDNFTNLFAKLASRLPVLAIPGPQSRVQPIYVRDVAQAVLTALQDSRCAGQVYDLAGPQVYTMAELARQCALWAGHRRPVIGMPMARLQARLFECLPGEPLLSRDNLDTLKRDNVAANPLAPELKLVPVALEAVAPAYLAQP